MASGDEKKGTASILAIGTELTTGQITNRNAAWLSERLTALGVEVVLHETVADDWERIKDALNRCASVSQFIFATGGLGPTTDDFTRNVIAEWLDKPLEFHESVWQQIEVRLSAIGVPNVETNRQQCYFPVSATILKNPEGTAAGFSVAIGEDRTDIQLKLEKRIWVFPGPPHELKTVWELGAEPMVKNLLPPSEPTQLLTWQCMGKSEAELGELTELALAGSGLQTGYRAHWPYVEIKVWCPFKQVQEKKSWFDNLEKTIDPWIVTKQGADLATRLLHHLKGRTETVEIFDTGSGGLFGARIGPLLRESLRENPETSITLITEWMNSPSPSQWVAGVLENGEDGSITLILSDITLDGKVEIGLRDETGKARQQSFSLPYFRPQPARIERLRHYLVELALKKWSDWLDTSVN